MVFNDWFFWFFNSFLLFFESDMWKIISIPKFRVGREGGGEVGGGGEQRQQRWPCALGSGLRKDNLNRDARGRPIKVV